jgi:alpha-galactosidase
LALPVVLALALTGLARAELPMIFYPYGPHASWSQVVGAAQWLNTNGYVKHGYNTIVMECGAFGATRAADGSIQLDPTRFPMGPTNLIAMLRTNGCYLGAQQQFYPTDNSTLCDCWDSIDPMIQIGPTNAYRDGFTIGQWGMSHIWIGCVTNVYQDEGMFRYLTENFAAGLYDGAACVNAPFMPSVELSYGISVYPDYRWLPEDFNAIFANPAGLPDPQTLKPTQLQAHYFSIISDCGWLYNGHCVPSIFGGCFGYNVDGASWRTVDAMRFEFGMACMESLPLAFNSVYPTAAESVIVTNDLAIAIDKDPLRAPAFIISSNSTSAVIGKELMNGDTAIALWNLNTNSSTSISVNLLSIPGILTNAVALVDIFDQTLTAATNTLSATVNKCGLNMYRLLAAPTVTGPSAGRLGSLVYSPATGFGCTFSDATIGQPYRILTSPSLAAGSWTDFTNFTYTGPMVISDPSAANGPKFYRAVSP